MTIRNITSVVIAALSVIVMASCGTSRNYPDRRDYPGSPYPGGYPYPDGRYPDGRYPDGRSYPTTRYPNRMPPGQAKKVYGYKSAKVFAPGQQNKRWDDHDRNDHHKGKKNKNKSNRKY